MASVDICSRIQEIKRGVFRGSNTSNLLEIYQHIDGDMPAENFVLSQQNGRNDLQTLRAITPPTTPALLNPTFVTQIRVAESARFHRLFVTLFRAPAASDLSTTFAIASYIHALNAHFLLAEMTLSC